VGRRRWEGRRRTWKTAVVLDEEGGREDGEVAEAQGSWPGRS